MKTIDEILSISDMEDHKLRIDIESMLEFSSDCMEPFKAVSYIQILDSYKTPSKREFKNFTSEQKEKHYLHKQQRLDRMSAMELEAYKKQQSVNAVEWVKNNPEKNLVNRTRRRVRRSIGTTDELNLANIKVRFIRSQSELPCSYCSKIILRKDFHIDHILPLIKGGLHTAENLCVSCQPCNSSKGSKILNVEWFPPNSL